MKRNKIIKTEIIHGPCTLYIDIYLLKLDPLAKAKLKWLLNTRI